MSNKTINTIGVELDKYIEQVKFINPWMNQEEATEFAMELLKKEQPNLFKDKKPVDPNDVELSIDFFEECDVLDALIRLKKYFKEVEGLDEDKAQEKVDKVYRGAFKRHFTCNPTAERDLESEEIFKKAVIDPFYAEKAGNMKAPEPAVVEEPAKEAESVEVVTNPGDTEANFDPSNPAAAYFQQQYPVQQMMMNPQIPQQPMPQQVQQYPVNPMFMQRPMHKVDEPPKAPKPAPAPQIYSETGLEGVNFNGLVKRPPVQVVPEVVNHKMVNPTIPVEITSNLYNNEIMIANYPKIPLQRIQDIANANGHSVSFEEYPWTGIISVTTVDTFGNIVPPKCFVIDTGMIIDPRVKIMATNPKVNANMPLEMAPMYELFYIDGKQHGKKLLDEKIINDIFYAGIANISKKQMYSEEYKLLNTKLALITIPTKGITKEMRNAVQNYLMEMDRHGDFDKAIALSPGCRFVFKTEQLNRDHLSDFVLINEGVPKFYGTPVVPVNPVIIESKDGKVSIRGGRT